MFCLVTDPYATTNARDAHRFAANEILAAWGINEQVEAELIADCTDSMGTIVRLAQRYIDRAPQSGEFQTWVERFKAALVAELKIDQTAQYCLSTLQQSGNFDLAILLSPEQAQLQPAPISEFFPADSLIVVDHSRQDDAISAIQSVVKKHRNPADCIAVFGNANNVKAGAETGIRRLGSVNGQGPAEADRLRLAGADEIVVDWVGVVSYMTRTSPYNDLLSVFLDLPPHEPTYNWGPMRGPPASVFNPPESYFAIKMPPPWIAPWLYFPSADPRKLSWEELVEVMAQQKEPLNKKRQKSK